MKAASSNTHYYYNVLEEPSIPGEWFLDEDTDWLYVYPMDGAMQPSDVVCTTTTSAEYLVTVSGASNVLISGITFEVGNGRHQDREQRECFIAALHRAGYEQLWRRYL